MALGPGGSSIRPPAVKIVGMSGWGVVNLTYHALWFDLDGS
jgi:hypothetical protein